MGTLVPDQTLIYERADGVVYARYRDPPYNKQPRWIVGGDPTAVAQAQGELFSYSEWQNLCKLANKNPTLKKQLDKAVEIYFLIKDS